MGQMTRTVHYRTCNPVSKSKFKILKKALRKINSNVSWGLEDMKLWRGHGPVGERRAWGFTKVKTEKGARLVVDSIKKLSSKIPGLAWIVLDEGELRPRKFRIKDGRVITLF